MTSLPFPCVFDPYDATIVVVLGPDRHDLFQGILDAGTKVHGEWCVQSESEPTFHVELPWLDGHYSHY